MTENTKIQSSKHPLLSISCLVFPLVCMFLLGLAYDPAVFHYLSLALFFGVIILVIFRQKFIQRAAIYELQIQDLQERINVTEAQVVGEEQSIASYREKIVNFSRLKGLTERLGSCLTTEDTSQTLSAEINRLFGDEDTTIILYLFHSKTGELGISSSQKGQMRVNLKSKRGDLYDKWIVKTMQPLLITDTHSDYRFDSDNTGTEDDREIRSLMSVPMMAGNKALGIIRVDSPRDNHFDTEDLRFLTTIGDLGALAMENAQLYERVEQLAIKDSLTGLYLRRYLLERFPEETSRHLRRNAPLSFLMIDIDKFKQYNDQYGHIAGDIVLRTLALILTEHFREPGSLICRYGGEEFCVLLPDCPKEKAVETADAFRKKVESQTIILRRKKSKVTVSVGVAAFPVDAQMKDELIRHADEALYRAKSTGRNRVVTV